MHDADTEPTCGVSGFVLCKNIGGRVRLCLDLNRHASLDREHCLCRYPATGYEAVPNTVNSELFSQLERDGSNELLGGESLVLATLGDGPCLTVRGDGGELGNKPAGVLDLGFWADHDEAKGPKSGGFDEETSGAVQKQ